MDNAIEISVNVVKVPEEPEVQQSSFRTRLIGQLVITVIVAGTAVATLVTSGQVLTVPTVSSAVIGALAGLYLPQPRLRK